MPSSPIISLHGLDDVDLHFDAERARLLRRRFLWLCAISTVLSFVFAFFSLPRVVETRGMELAGALTTLVGDLLSTLIYIVAFVYAYRTTPRTSTFLRLAFWLFVGGTTFAVVYNRVGMELDLQGWFEGTTANAAFAWLWVAPFFILFSHFFTSLFMPWSLRESLIPAAIVLAVVAGIISLDLAHEKVGSLAWISLLFCALAILPGALICWLRFSRYRQKFEHKYFSSAYRQLKRELSTARRIHESSLPPPKDDGPVRLGYAYEPMREIGGDLLFVPMFARTSDERRLSAVLLDVTGHGIAAALAVNRIVGELERLFAERPDASPDYILGSLNRYLCLTMSRHSLYATALCVRIDSERDVLEYASGGHPPALLRRADGSVELLDPTSMLLGAMDGEDFATPLGSVPLMPGDTLLAYTDGATEARNGEGSDLGIAGLRQLLTITAKAHPSIQTWPEALLDQVRSFRAGPAEDDTLVVTLHRPALPVGKTPTRQNALAAP